MTDEIRKVAPNSRMARNLRKPVSAAERREIERAAKRRLADAEEDVDVAPVARRASRMQTRQPTREAPRKNSSDRIEVVGRDGETLSRKQRVGIDPYEIPPSIIPSGWEYQWNAISVVGNADVLQTQTLQMHENGWRPVPASRHPGRFVPVGSAGAIIRGGLRLEERPKALSQEARNEELLAARQLVTDRNESLQLTSLRDKMPSGFDMNRKYRGTGGDVRISIDTEGDIPPASHQIEE